MPDTFNDIPTNTDSDETTETTSTEDISDMATSFSDAVRSTLPQDDTINEDEVYKHPETGDEADDVDPRGLFQKPTVNELRYYARQGPYGRPIVEKPIRDAFKHGYEITGDYTETTDGSGKARDFLETYKDYYIEAEIKSRRDGMCVLMHQVADAADSVGDPIDKDTASFEDFKIWTLDNLSDEVTAAEVADYVPYEHDQIYVSEGEAHGGIAIVDDISDPNHGEILGYGIEPRQDSLDVRSAQFLHADRCDQFVWGEWVDGDVGNNVTGHHVGESVLTNVLQPLKATQMGYWALKNIFFRYSAPLHAVEPPETWGTEEFETFTEKLDNISMASDATLPPGAELSVAEGVSEFDPEPFYDVLVEAICSGTVFTKPVLQGTQSGTVTGSETSLKGYFNEIHILRTERIEHKFRHVLKKVSEYDPETVPPLTNPNNLQFNWGALFKPTDIEQAEGAVSLITAATNGIKNYVLTPDEARSLVEEEWATFDIDVDLDALTEDDRDALDRINMNEAGQGASDNEPDTSPRENPRRQNGGGQPSGQTRSSSQPQRSSTDSLTDEDVNRIADSVVEKLSTE